MREHAVGVAAHALSEVALGQCAQQARDLGQLAVGRVIVARSRSGRFPNSYCGVVYQPSQFSFVRGGRMPSINMDSRHWRNAVAIALIVS